MSDKPFFTEEHKKLIIESFCKEFPAHETARVLAVCERLQLDPLVKQIYIRPQGVNHGTKDKPRWVKEAVIITSIDGARAIAERSGEYRGQTHPQWCGNDGEWKDVWLRDSLAPTAARVGIHRAGFVEPVYGVATYESYAQFIKAEPGKPATPNAFWRRMPDVLLSKCFSGNTSILTERGFVKFRDVKGERIAQVNSGRIEFVDAKPFRQDYDGLMIELASDMLDFSVTPNHDMVTTFGKVEALAMYHTSVIGGRAKWRIPMSVPISDSEIDAIISDDDLRLIGYVIADGYATSGSTFTIKVSRLHKIAALRAIAPAGERLEQANGYTARTATRDIRSNFDKLAFAFPVARVHDLISLDKEPNYAAFAMLSGRQSKIVVDAWHDFDGHANRITAARRIYMNRESHVGLFEMLAVKAGYSVSAPKERGSDISSKPNFYLTISEVRDIAARRPIGKQPGMSIIHNDSGSVWCVSVPSGVIVVRRRGFSMLCGNCSEMLAIRKAFPLLLAGVYIEEEIGSSEEDAELAAKAREDYDSKYVDKIKPKPFKQDAPAEKPKIADGDSPKPAETAKEMAKMAKMAQEVLENVIDGTLEEMDKAGEKDVESEFWRDHVITQIKAEAFKGRMLGELSEKELIRLKTAWVDKFADNIAKDPNKQREADMILLGIAEIAKSKEQVEKKDDDQIPM